jgi:hypothetical protein
MRRIWIVLAVAILAVGVAAASDNAEVMATVHQFVDGFNKGDVKSALATCAEQTSIIDEFPPHEWHGAGACATWAQDYEADAKKNGITDPIVTLGKSRVVDVTADRAYLVFTTDYTYKQNGKPMKETGSTFIFALQKGDSGWRITGWAWGKH